MLLAVLFIFEIYYDVFNMSYGFSFYCLCEFVVIYDGNGMGGDKNERKTINI